jgi:dihydrofolate reductase
VRPQDGTSESNQIGGTVRHRGLPRRGHWCRSCQPRPPAPGGEIQPFASFINAVTKYVATSTPFEGEWTNSRVIDGGLVDFVRHLKGRLGGDIGVAASLSVTRTLLAADVVDELRLVVAPTIAGSGQRLLDGLPPIRLDPIRSTASPSGHLVVDYRMVRQAPFEHRGTH